jgi:LacI family transcriptional regulator
MSAKPRAPYGTDDGSARRRITVHEVATLAGVSVGTVSNVVNHPTKVSPETLQRVRAAMTQLGWTPDQVAQQLRGGRSTAIGAVVVELSPHTVRLLDSIDGDLTQAGLSLQITTSAHDPHRELDRIELFAQQRVRGVLLSPVQDSYQLHLDHLNKIGIPLVLLGREAATPNVCSASVDDIAGGRLAVAHLVAFGHRRIAAVGGRADNHHVRARIAGAMAATAGTASLTVYSTDTYDVQAGIQAARAMAATPADERPTAVFAINDLIAIGLQRGLRLSGLRIPEDVSIVGYDDLPLAQTGPVPLTTIRNPHLVIARRATSLLLREIADADTGATHTHTQLQLEPDLVVRESTVRTGNSHA